MTIKVLMLPTLESASGKHGGINRVIEGWHQHAADYEIEYVLPAATSYDLLVSHAGASSHHLGILPDLAVCHGLYWINDSYPVNRSLFSINAVIIEEIRHAGAVSVPSTWVAKTFLREMRFAPHIIPHAINWDEWQGANDKGSYILFNKNRPSDACDPSPVSELALMHPDQLFLSTFTAPNAPQNISQIGTMDHKKMRAVVQRAGIYLSFSRETFGIGVLEAMASGVPVLGWDIGGNREIVEHGVTGYLAQYNNYEDLSNGLLYCLEHRDILGANGREKARNFTWMNVCQQVREVYDSLLSPSPPSVDIIIPSYNYGDKVSRAITSALEQSYPIGQVIVVDDGSPDEGKTESVVASLQSHDSRLRYHRIPNSGVANARNAGITLSSAKYICCIDADDAIEPAFISRLVPVLENDPSLGIAYTGLRWVLPNGYTRESAWPGEFRYDAQLEGKNQVPTCCLFRREMWRRLGGYKQRYAPSGAGAEDAEFWLRAGAIGYNAVKATSESLFIYSAGTGHTFQDGYQEVNWTFWHPWTKDNIHPLASVATPRNGYSHPVRQYDSPDVAVIIPVGPKHKERVMEAIDSVEAQTFRNWELVVAWDMEDGLPESMGRAYPYITWVFTGGKGAGAARNAAAAASTAPFLLFLDADDTLKPTCLEVMVAAWNAEKSIVYSDYEAHATGISDDDARRALQERRLIYRDETGYTIWSRKSADYDCERAMRQRIPDNPPYIWNLITSLVPRAWHDEIGGFDESVPSWEDWDYWVRMAFACKPFVRVTEPLVAYYYHTGGRRDEGYEIGGQLLQYFTEKYSLMEDITMPCTGCGPKRPTYQSSSRPAAPAPTSVARAASVSSVRVPVDSDFIRCKYTHPNRGWHRFVGPAAFEYQFELPGDSRVMHMVRNSDGSYSVDYGQHCGGDIFLAHKADVDLSRYLEPVEEYSRAREMVDIPAQQGEVAPVAPPKPTSSIQEIKREVMEVEAREQAEEEGKAGSGSFYDQELALRKSRAKQQQLDTPPSISYNKSVDVLPVPASVLKQLKDEGYETIDDCAHMTAEDWMEFRGIGEVKASALVEAVQMQLGK